MRRTTDTTATAGRGRSAGRSSASGTPGQRLATSTPSDAEITDSGSSSAAEHLPLPQRVIRVLHRKRLPRRHLTRSTRRVGQSSRRASTAPSRNRPRRCDAPPRPARTRCRTARATAPEPATSAVTSKPAADQRRCTSSNDIDFGDRRPADRSGTTSDTGSTTWYPTPSTSGYTVRSDSCRPTTIRAPQPATPRHRDPRQPDRHRNVVHRRIRIEPVQEPHPLLRQRQRNPLRTRLRPRAAPPVPNRHSLAPRPQVLRPSTPRTTPAPEPARPAPHRGARRTCVAISELPPRAKKSSSRPTRSTPSTSANTAATISSIGVVGARNSRASNTGSGSAFRSSLPFAVSGTASSTTNADGTM